MGITAEEIRAIRAELKVSRKEMAKMIGASRSSMDYWERGIFTPGAKFARKIRSLVKKAPEASLPKAPEVSTPKAPETPLHKAKAMTALEHAENFRSARQRNLVNDAIKYTADESQMAPGYLRAQITTFLAIVQDNQNLTVQEVLDNLANS